MVMRNILKLSQLFFKFSNENVLLYRGMSYSAFQEFLKNGFKKTLHKGNVASKDITTAELYAKDHDQDEDEAALVIKFIAPLDAVEFDEWFPDDCRFIKDFFFFFWELVSRQRT